MADIAFPDALPSPRQNPLYRLFADLVLCGTSVVGGVTCPGRASALHATTDRSRPPAVEHGFQGPTDCCPQFPYWETMGWWIPAAC
jgi:hypothetical protein